MLPNQSKIALKLLIFALVIIVNENGISADLEGSSSRQLKDFTSAQQKFQSEMLNAHNNYRARHCARALHLDPSLTRSAQNYAQKLAKINTMVHSGTKGVGENLYMMSSSGKITTIDGMFLD